MYEASFTLANILTFNALVSSRTTSHHRNGNGAQDLIRKLFNESYEKNVTSVEIFGSYDFPKIFLVNSIFGSNIFPETFSKSLFRKSVFYTEWKINVIGIHIQESWWRKWIVKPNSISKESCKIYTFVINLRQWLLNILKKKSNNN